ncbi:MAG: Gfo/Idh/MocA family oxidoreductase [Proteobacteria bacterium]|nr:Gfo/Idh/MocA family oxidoreductase [Pseudomonadota bacterium]
MIKAAIVGLGGWGQVLVRSVQNKSPRIRFTAGVTRTPAKAEAFARENGFPVHAELDAVLKDPAIDAVVLATPHSQHSEQVVRAAKAGKHVMVEKPFTLTKASAEAAVGACRNAGVVFALAHNRRFLPATRELKARIQSGSLGTVLHAEGHMSGPSGHFYEPGLWRVGDDESPVGNMAAMGIHMLDHMINLLGPIDDVYVRSYRRVIKVPMDDTTAALFTFRNGYSGYLATIATTARVWRMFVWGSKAMAEMRGQNELYIHPVGPKPRDVPEPERIAFPPPDIERAELEALADAIEGKAPYPLPPEEAVHGAAVFEAMYKATKSGRTVKVA